MTSGLTIDTENGTIKKETDTKLKNDNKNDDDEYIVPDGGWGWVVTFCCFFVYLILDGAVFSFGVIYVELLDYFNETGGKTAIAAALLYGLPLILAPLNCALVSCFGYKIIALIGSVLTSITFIFSSISPNLDILIALLGTSGAMGMQMCYVAPILCLTYYFDKNRGLATGLALSGSGFGTLVFPPLLEFLLEKYTWRGTCLIVGGICLHLIPCSLVFLPLEKKQVAQDEEALLKDEILHKKDIVKSIHCDRKMSQSMIDLPKMKKTLKNKLHSSDPALSENILSANNHKTHLEFISAFHHGGYAVALSMASVDDKERTTRRTNNREKRQNLKDRFMTVVKSTVDISLFTDKGFMLFSVSNFLLCIYFGLPYVYIPHLAQLSGIGQQEASFLISIIGITTISQVVIGFIGDKSRASMEIYTVCMLGAGGALMATPYFAANYAVLSILCVVFGIGVSANFALTTLILIDLIGLEKLNVAFGMLLLQQGVASLCGTPIGGWVYDATGSYYWAFMSAGICILISAVVLIPIPFLIKINA